MYLIILKEKQNKTTTTKKKKKTPTPQNILISGVHYFISNILAQEEEFCPASYRQRVHFSVDFSSSSHWQINPNAMNST